MGSLEALNGDELHDAGMNLNHSIEVNLVPEQESDIHPNKVNSIAMNQR